MYSASTQVPEACPHSLDSICPHVFVEHPLSGSPCWDLEDHRWRITPIPTRYTHTLVQESDTTNHSYKVGGDQGFNPKHSVSSGEGKIDFQSKRTKEGKNCFIWTWRWLCF